MKLQKIAQLFALALLVSLAACKGKPKELIAQKWELDIAETKKAMLAQIEQIKKNKPDVGKLMEEGMKDFDKEAAKMKMTLEFKKDGSAETYVGDMKEEGKWSISEDGKKITMEEKGGKKSEVEVLELSKSKLVLKMKESGEEQTMAFKSTK